MRIAIIILFLTTLAHAQTVETPKAQPEQVVFTWFFHGEQRDWLTVQRSNVNDYEDRGTDPSYTSIQSDYKPLVRKLESGKYEIVFTSDVR